MNDYTIMAIEEQMSMSQELGMTLLNSLNEEHQYIMECYEAGVVLEAENITNAAKPKKSLWERIKDFFRRIFGLFKNKTDDMIAKNNEFLNAIKPLIITGSMDGLTLEVLDFNSTQKMSDISNKIINDVKSLRGKTKEDAEKALEELEKKHSNGEGLASGLKMEFRIGNPNGTLTYTSYTGANLRTKLSEMCDFCLNYQANYTQADNIRKRYEDNIKNIEQNFPDEVAESLYLALEGCFVDELVGLDVSLEAKSPVGGSLSQQSVARAAQQRAEMSGNNNGATTDNKTTNTSDANKDNVSATGGGITKDENTNGEKEEKTINAGKAGSVKVTKNNASLENKLFKVGSTVMTAYITVMEEKYTAYIARLKDWANADVDTKSKKSIKDLVKMPGQKVASAKRNAKNAKDKAVNNAAARGLVGN